MPLINSKLFEVCNIVKTIKYFIFIIIKSDGNILIKKIIKFVKCIHSVIILILNKVLKR